LPTPAKPKTSPAQLLADLAERQGLTVESAASFPRDLKRAGLPATLGPAVIGEARRLTRERIEGWRMKWLACNEAGQRPYIVVEGDARFDPWNPDPVLQAELHRAEREAAERDAKLAPLREAKKLERVVEREIKAELAQARQRAAIRDKRLPAPGTVLFRDHKGKRVEVKVLDDGFEHAGQHHASLSEAVEAATGAVWNGFKFFNL
jgi:hypothetical protein